MFGWTLKYRKNKRPKNVPIRRYSQPIQIYRSKGTFCISCIDFNKGKVLKTKI